MAVLTWAMPWLCSALAVLISPISALTRAITALGPAYIKFGQILSTRPDIVGEELADQLKYLQDKLPPFGMADARKAGLEFNVMTSSFFLGRRRPVVTGPIGLERMLDNIYAVLSRFSADPSDYFHLPRDRVVELGERVAV